MKCHECGREIARKDSFRHQKHSLCEDCYIKALSKVNERECDPWATYLSARERGGAWPKTTDNLTELQKGLFDFIKSRGKVTREGLIAKYRLTEEEMGLHINVLMHSELIKERSEGGRLYLIPIPVPRES